MDGRLVAIAALLVSGMLAGCAGEEETDDERVQQQIEEGDTVLLPEWDVEQYWTYDLSANGSTIGKSSFVVTSADGGDYILETNDKNVAYYDARFDITFLGEVRKSDLAGSQNGDRVEMFQWPLGADMTWTTTWDGLSLNMESMSMGPKQFHVMGHDDQGRMAVEYHYNGEVEWFEYMIFYDVETGDEGFRLDLDGSGVDFDGTIYRYTIQDVEEFTVGPGSAQQAQRAFSEVDEIGLTIGADCNGDPAGQILIGAGPVDDDQAMQLPWMPFFNEPDEGMTIDCAQDSGDEYTVVEEVAGQTWAIDMASASQNGVGWVYVEPRIVETLEL